MIEIQRFAKDLGLEILSGSNRGELNITSPETNRPGMQFCGVYEYFAQERPQIIGKMEMSYLEAMTCEKRREVLENFMSYPIPCIIICWDMPAPAEMVEIADEHNVPLFRSRDKTTTLCTQLILYLNRELAPRVTKHGVLLDVYGVGVLITGESGVGKSEAALELIKRGHQLAADDVVEICRVSDDRLVGEAPEMIRHFMEIRGIGIIDIRAMFGIGSVLLSKSIDMVIHLEKWDSTKEYDRFGLTEETTSILGVNVPYQVMPVKPGRNLAIIIEVAARNLSLKRMGYSAAQELDHRLNELIANSEKEKKKEGSSNE